MADKVFKTHNSQLRILRSRGLIVKTSAKNVLENENYYNVINGYKDLFLDNAAATETYKAGAEFSEIFALYEFDRELRFIFLKRLLKLENRIKSVIAYKFSEQYGHDNYLKLDNFDYHGHDNKQLQNIMSVVSTFQRSISDQSGKHNAVTHYVTEYGYVPLWVLVNVLTFGNISKFYGILKLRDRQAIAKEFELQENVFKSYLKLMSIFRNICAHDERLHNTKLGNLEIVSGPLHARLAIPLANGKPKYGKNDLFALLICLKELLPNRTRGEFSETIMLINKEIEKLQRNMHTVNINDILVTMGFPTNWKSL